MDATTVINISYTLLENKAFSTFLCPWSLSLSLHTKESANLQSCIPCKRPSFLQSCSRLDIKYCHEIVLNVTLASDISYIHLVHSTNPLDKTLFNMKSQYQSSYSTSSSVKMNAIKTDVSTWAPVFQVRMREEIGFFLKMLGAARDRAYFSQLHSELIAIIDSVASSKKWKMDRTIFT